MTVVVKRIDNAHEDSVWSVAWSKVGGLIFPDVEILQGRVVSGSLDERVKTWYNQSLRNQVVTLAPGSVTTSIRSINSKVTRGV